MTTTDFRASGKEVNSHLKNPLPGAPPAITGTHDRVTGTPGSVTGTRPDRSGGTMRMLTVLAIAGGTVLAGIGFTGSYSALVRLGYAHGFGWFAHVFPIGVDAGIVVLLALDLHLIRRGTPWPVLRLLAHGFTAATIVFNASSTGRPLAQDPIGAGMHGVIPIMFVASVEAGRRLVIRMARIAAGREAAGVPLHRWLLAPWPSWSMYRRMRLWAIPSYAQAVALERERVVYRVMLDRKFGDWRKAPSDARLPLTMARYGLTVDEALALPQEAEEAERLRAEQAKERAADMVLRAERRATDAEIVRLQNQGDIQAARVSVEAETGVAEVQSRAAVAEAEAAARVQSRAALRDVEAEESATVAESNLRAAVADEAAAVTRSRTAETDRAAAVTEQHAAEARRRTADENQHAAVAEAATEAAKADAAAERKRAAEMEHGAAVTHRRAAETELLALEAEDLAQLKPTERVARKVARMILADGHGNPEHVDLQAIADALGVSLTTASQRRKEAAELLAGGYRPTGIEKGTHR